METENFNRCMHDDCFTCPYKDCISETDPGEHKKPGRKKLSLEEKKARKAAYMREYERKHKERRAQAEKERYHRKKAMAAGMAIGE